MKEPEHHREKNKEEPEHHREKNKKEPENLRGDTRGLLRSLRKFCLIVDSLLSSTPSFLETFIYFCSQKMSLAKGLQSFGGEM